MTPLRILPRYAWTYVVYWPDAIAPGIGVLKVGRAWSRSRLRGLVERGAQVISNTGNTDETWELWALRFLATEYEPAFASADEASDLMPKGHGWTECFVVREEDVYFAMDLAIYGYSYGNERGTNEPVRSASHALADLPPAPADEEEAPPHAPYQAVPDRPQREEAPIVTKASPPARVTARALWLMTDAQNCRRIDLDELAAKIYPTDERAVARDAITLHILELEDAGVLSTYIADGGEWARFNGPFVDSETRADTGFDSTRLGGEGERARERARERVRAERARAERAWGAVRDREAAARPARPASIDAPPLGCPAHPHGSLFPCGPCGTARRTYDAFMDAQRYESKLADYEFWHGNDEEAAPDDEPF